MKNSIKVLGFMLTLVLTLVLGISSTSAASNESSSEVKFDINKDLTSDEISTRFQEINSSYKIGESFSEEDTEFIKLYANNALTGTPKQSPDIGLYAMTSDSFNKTKTKYQTTVHFFGNLYSDINIVNHSYRGNISAKITSGASRVSNLELVVTNIAYGVLGNEGTYIGIVYDDSISGSSEKTAYSFDKTKEYSAIGVAYTYTNAYVTVTTSSGDYDLYAF